MKHAIYRKLLSVLMTLFVVIAFATPISGYTSVSAAQDGPQKQFIKAPIKPQPIPYRYAPGAKAYHFDPPARPKLASAATSVIIHYVPAGQQNMLGDTCMAFPEAAKAAFTAAGQMWGNLLYSPVPITIEACWSDLPDGVLGWSSPSYIYSYNGAFYPQALANAIKGMTLDPIEDMSITYANGYLNDFYYGTDGNTPSYQLDFMSVVMHEIAHGLGFMGSMRVSGTSGYWGFQSDSGQIIPMIYDRFTLDSQWNYLLNTSVYPNPSTKLGSALTNTVYFNGNNARAANGGNGVRLFTPYPWIQGSSYSHLDYDTYSGTPNTLMVYAIGDGSSIHDPGPVSLGILKDIGWTTNTVIVPKPGDFSKGSPLNGSTGTPLTPTFGWDGSSNADSYQYCYDTFNNNICDTGWSSPMTSTMVTLPALPGGTTYYWQVRANNSAGSTEANSGAWWSFTTIANMPGGFSKGSPLNGSTGIPLTPTFGWDGSSYADNYQYCYDTSNNNVCDTGWSSPMASTMVTLPPLAGGTTYYWQVRANNSSGSTEANGGAWWSFTTIPNMPGSFSKTAPYNGATSTPLSTSLVWNPSSEATSYTYCYDTTNNNTCDGGWRGPVNGTVVNLTGLRGSTMYYWQVRATNTTGTTDALGGWWSFITVPPPPSIVSISSAGTLPGGDAVVTVTAAIPTGALMGSAAVEITYDPAVLSVKACTADPDGRLSTKTCNTVYAANKLRIDVTSAGGIAGNVKFASITFHALASSGSTTLTIQPLTFADINGPALATTPQNGMIIIANGRMYLPFLTR